MKILMVGSGSYKSSLTFRIVALGEQLAAQGHDVSLMVPSADKYNDFKPDKHAKLPNIKLLQPWQLATKNPMINLLPYLVTSFSAVLRARPDAVYLYKPTPVSIVGLLPRLLFRRPVILDLDDLGSEVMVSQGQGGLQAKLVAFCERFALRWSSAVVVTSTFLASIVKDKYPDKPLKILSNGVDPASYPLPSDHKPRKAIYYFGAVNRLSLVEATLRALPTVLAAEPKTQVYLLGGGSALEEAKQLAADLGVAHAVTFSGWIDMYAANQYAHFGDLAICYQPDVRTVRAASNMKVFQYMAMSMVPIVSDVGDLKLYVRDGKAGVAVPADDADALAQTLIELLRDDTRRSRLARAARKLAEGDYSWQRLGEQLDDFITNQTDRKG